MDEADATAYTAQKDYMQCTHMKTNLRIVVGNPDNQDVQNDLGKMAGCMRPSKTAFAKYPIHQDLTRFPALEIAHI